jgi:acyl-CoA thioesterase-2
MPEAPDPETVPTQNERAARWADKLPPRMRERATAAGPFELRTIEYQDPFNPIVMPPQRRVWVKADGTLPDDPALHRYLLAYTSDFAFLTTALLPHQVTWLSSGMQVASIDHVMWFHQPFRVDEWLLHVMESPRASGGRGLVRGRVFARDGRLVASTAQEGLIRRRTQRSKPPGIA